jgi:hypothetical protein
MNRIKIILLLSFFQFCFTTESVRFKDEAIETQPESVNNVNLKTEEPEEPIKTEKDSTEILEKNSTEEKLDEKKSATETRFKYRTAK